MSKLKKCPFCGGEAQVNTWTMHGITESRCFCSNSDCPNSVRTVALEQWNARPIEDALNARISELSQAVGLITTLKPTMVMDANHPLDMVREVAEHVTARIAELEAENETIISDYEERMDNLVNIGNETGRLLQAEIGYLNAQLGIKNLTTETLQLRIAELEAAQRWIPVSERLPEIGVRVLFYNNFIKNIHKGWYSGDEWTSDIGIFYNGDKLKRITHWMPLPSAHESEDE